MEDRHLYIISGCNGAGKTTASMTILPDMLNCREYINADEIARGLSPFHPEGVSFEAGRIMLGRIDELLNKGTDFAFETTLSAKTYVSRIAVAKTRGYRVTLLFFWLQDVNLAKERVKARVAEGGHGIPEQLVERRYARGIRNLFDVYLSIVDGALILDNSIGDPLLIAYKSANKSLEIENRSVFEKLIGAYERSKPVDSRGKGQNRHEP